jgi:hypothetical protein
VKVAAVHLRPDMTQIVEGRIQKNVLHIQRIYTMRSIFPALLNFQQDGIDEYFLELKDQIHNKNAEIYIGLTDDLFKKIDCHERDYVSPEQWDSVVPSWMNQKLKVDKEEYHVITPLHFENNTKSIITGFAIRSTFIDALLTAATTANLNIQSIEPSCFAMLRLLNQWEEEHCIMEVWERSTAMTGYSNIRGMFKINLSQGWSSFLMENGIERLDQSISAHDYTAFTTYQIANNNIPIYLVSDKSNDMERLLLESKFSSRFMNLSLSNKFIESKITSEQLSSFSIPLGLALAPLHERMIEDEDTSSKFNS